MRLAPVYEFVSYPDPRAGLSLAKTASGQLQVCESNVGAWPGDVGVVAYVHRRRIGVVTGRYDESGLRSHGSYVARAWRRQGIATQLWCRLIEETHARAVRLSIASAHGAALIAHLRTAHPGVCFEVSEERISCQPFRRGEVRSEEAGSSHTLAQRPPMARRGDVPGPSSDRSRTGAAC